MARWDAGAFIVEGRCQCRKADRSAECAARAVERATDSVMAFFYPSIVDILAARGKLP